MYFALVIDDYLPHSTRVAAKMFHELASQLLEQGHEVTVITPHFDRDKPALIEDSLDGVVIWRFLSGQIKDVPKVKRAINETLLSHRAWQAIQEKVDKDTFDGVVYYSPSIFFGSLVSKIKKRCQCKSYLVLRDFFPQWAVDSGLMKKGSLIERYFRFFESVSYRQADIIGVMSEKNLEIFKANTELQYPTTILRNWANLSPHHVSDKVANLKERLGLNDEVIYFYGGNIGHAQDMANLMRLTKSMQRFDNAHFLFLGQGDEVELVKDLIKEWNLTNCSYLPSVSQDEFKDILAQVDVGLFSLSAQHSAHNFPGKLLGYMVQSLPILGSVNKGNDLMDLVNTYQAGLISVNGDDDTFLENAIKLQNDFELRKKIGSAGYRLLEKEFAVGNIASSIVESFKDN
ncbi:glycosyltransferase family 4 protein [Vibrio splendidus]|uniref:glycosyltransferase family 4 protein n=1 Tax=Vibrio splendidus TaxID=29497 RepID=UPI000C8218F0|nr:glycosyltransferase family 4 protein [Vibrio splendidus]PMO94707.1 glycosyltransferase WbuB [Vibrio splendidus]PMP20151.1 glycosyltransferase WbuB [Vibrio splendidus]PMP36836.1 glycosyltransferase WbuB [Vibrio splendidus]PMP41717.1 glycosyltransferase WbuB [Vibrio splendidus]PMP45732.1 glycosyltransferase WbuB [Vibrio splendidus]